MNAWTEKRIFPGAYPPTLREMMDILEPYNFSVLDVENLRLHYARTLEHWQARYNQAVDEVIKQRTAAGENRTLREIAPRHLSKSMGAVGAYQKVLKGRRLDHEVRDAEEVRRADHAGPCVVALDGATRVIRQGLAWQEGEQAHTLRGRLQH